MAVCFSKSIVNKDSHYLEPKTYTASYTAKHTRSTSMGG